MKKHQLLALDGVFFTLISDWGGGEGWINPPFFKLEKTTDKEYIFWGKQTFCMKNYSQILELTWMSEGLVTWSLDTPENSYFWLRFFFQCGLIQPPPPPSELSLIVLRRALQQCLENLIYSFKGIIMNFLHSWFRFGSKKYGVIITWIYVLSNLKIINFQLSYVFILYNNSEDAKNSHYKTFLLFFFLFFDECSAE